MRWIVPLLFLIFPVGAQAIPATIQQEGVLMNDQGIPYEGPTQMRFSLYEQAEGGAALWFEDQNLNLHLGYYSATLGSQTAFEETLNGEPRFIGVSVDGAEMSPRVQLSSVPYARLAEDVEGDINPHSISVGGEPIIDEGGNWIGPPIDGTNDGVGYNTPEAALAAVKGVDGSGSGLDADLLDGLSSAAFIQGDDQVMVLVQERDGGGSGLDADQLDGHDSSVFVRTAAQLLELLLTVDGASSGLDADHLDGHNSAEFMSATDPAAAAAQLLGLLLSVDGQGSTLNADRLDGLDSSAFMRTGQAATATQILNLLLTVDGAGSEMDADLLDGLQASSFMRVDQDTETSGDLAVGGLFSSDGAQITGTLTANRVEANFIQARQAKLTPLNASPENPLKGTLYFDGQVHDLRIFNGTGWEPIGGFQVGNTFGNGSDGEITITNANTIVNDYAYLNASVDANQSTITLNDASPFSVGEQVLIIQMQEADGANYPSGVYEFKDIVGKDGNNLTFASGLKNSYGHATPNTSNSIIAQVVRVPQYTDVTINAGASITASAWDGYKGGIVVFRATGALNMNGAVDVSQKGFRGGSCNGCGNASWGDQGESISGRGGQSIERYRNGGGGGYGPSGCGGSCGGGGGHGTAGGVGDHISCNGIDSPGGEAIGDPMLEKIFFGGGAGGGGDNDGLQPSPQYADGGGIVIINASQIIDARIYSKGEDEIYSGSYGGQTGGGAGGTIWLTTNEINITQVDARGGAGGFNDGYCIGGAGGDGRIKISSFGNISGSTTPAYHEDQQ